MAITPAQWYLVSVVQRAAEAREWLDEVMKDPMAPQERVWDALYVVDMTAADLREAHAAVQKDVVPT